MRPELRLVGVPVGIGLLSLLMGCRADPGSVAATAEPSLSAPTRAVTLVIGPTSDPYVRAVVAGARQHATAEAVPLLVQDPTEATEQRRRVGEAITRRDRAIAVAPTDYLDLYLLLRTAHDQDVPTFVLDLDPPPATNQAYVWSFLSSGRRQAAALAARGLARRMTGSARADVLLVSSAGPRSAAALDEAEATLTRMRPGARVRRVVVGTGESARLSGLVGGAAGVLAADERAGEVVAAAMSAAGVTARVPAVAVGATESELMALRSGALDELAAVRAVELGRLLMRFAVQSAANRPEQMPRMVTLEPIALTAKDLGTARERQARYPG